MPLTDNTVRGAKAGKKAIKLFDGEGLYLQVSPTGGKWWRFKYRFNGKEKLLSLGVYPQISLKEARDRKHEMRKLLANHIDPGEHRKAIKAANLNKASNSLEIVAREWYSKHVANWSEIYAKKTLNRLEKDLFPWLGTVPICDLTPPAILTAIRRIENRGALETAHRVLGLCGKIFRYAVATGRAERDVTADLRGALPPTKSKHFAAVIEPKKVGELLRTIEGYQGSIIVQCALRFAPLVFVRPSELRQAKWSAIDFDKAEWCYTVTKTQTEHIVPLSTQALAILRTVQPITGRGRYVFPSARSADRPMSDNAILAAMRRMGVAKEEMSGHGFRAMARTMLDEVLGVRPDYIEHQLAHAVRDPNGRAYNRTAHLPERCQMMQQWADYLDQLKKDS
ncbi:MAG: integrase arm-type DNA-binding domain-containing protein [Gammaproteobacteria bacterium]|nr:integrase arm-type DNA-binding domain-containing protein [Gammaproteobacteria bacterium]